MQRKSMKNLADFRVRRRSILAGAGGALAGLMLPLSARAQSFPAKPIRFIVPLAPGGSADMLARLVGQHLSQRLGQPVVVEMRPGGGTVIGTAQVAKAPADGYTLLFASNSLVINAKLRSNLSYDGIKAFEPVAMMVSSPQVLAVNTASPYRTFKQWLAAARAQPGTVSLASLGPDTTQHMASEMLQHTSGTQLIYAPYSGGALAVNAVLGGHVDTVLGNLAEMSAHIEADRLRPLAVTTRSRLSALPQVPTIAESGYPGFEAIAWFGVAAPAGTPHEVINLLADGVKSAMNDAEIRQQLLTFSLQPDYLGPAEFAAHIAQQYQHYARIIEEAHIQVL
jgi:tripartite-type tricarboxylate transporter receptor subunit TctC